MKVLIVTQIKIFKTILFLTFWRIVLKLLIIISSDIERYKVIAYIQRQKHINLTVDDYLLKCSLFWITGKKIGFHVFKEKNAKIKLPLYNFTIVKATASL